VKNKVKLNIIFVWVVIAVLVVATAIFTTLIILLPNRNDNQDPPPSGGGQYPPGGGGGNGQNPPGGGEEEDCPDKKPEPPENKIEILSVAILFDENVVSSVDKAFNSQPFSFGVLVNGGDVELEDVDISWSIAGEALNSSINSRGLFTVGNMIGEVVIRVEVAAENTMYTTAMVNIIIPQEFRLASIDVNFANNNRTFIEGQIINPDNLMVEAFFEDILESAFVRDFDYQIRAFEISDITTAVSFAHGGVAITSHVPVIVVPRTLQGIELQSMPTRLQYVEGEIFDAKGLVVVANYEFILGVEITNFVIVNEGEVLTPKIKYVTIMFAEDGITKTLVIPITVSPKILQKITVDYSNVRLEYTQGDMFDADGLVVTAHFEVFYMQVDGFEISITSWLLATHSYIIVLYGNNGVTKTYKINITVLAPYSIIREIQIENHLDVRVDWIYSYVNKNGERVVDFNEINPVGFYGLNLGLNVATGVVRLPVGAVVTITAINPAIIDFLFNGELQGLAHPERAWQFVLENENNALDIAFRVLPGQRLTVRFDSEAHRLIFNYPLHWNYVMRAVDLAVLGQVFEDTIAYYYMFSINGQVLTFAEVSEFEITGDIVFNVARVERTSVETTIVINVVYYNNITLSVVVDRTNANALAGLPRVHRVGYSIVGFSTTSSGSLFDEATFADWLNAAQNGYTIFAQFQFTAQEQEGDILGVWESRLSTEIGEVLVTITFNQDGRYEYIVAIDGVINSHLWGIYTYFEGRVNILSIETDAEFLLVSISDFEIELENNVLSAPIIVVDGFEVVILQAKFIKV